MPFAYYDRLSPSRKRTYRASDAIVSLSPPEGFAAFATVARIEQRLAGDDRAGLQAAAQSLVDALVKGFRVPPVHVRVLSKRPSDDYGELHGLYEPDEDRPIARVTVWMRTAQRQQVVAFKTFLRTLIHEFCHHLDYEHFKLEETFHTEGFYKRESTLVAALIAGASSASTADAPA